MRLFLLVVTAVLAGLFYLGITSIVPTSNRDSLIKQTQALTFDAYAEGINTTLYDESGGINYTLEARRQVHYNNGITELDAPIIILFEDGNSRWNIKADSGRIFTSSDIETEQQTVDNIELKGNVEATGIDETGNLTLLLTELMFVNPDLETLQTDQHVRMISKGLNMTSLGMFADLSKDEISFHSQVGGSYADQN